MSRAIAPGMTAVAVGVLCRPDGRVLLAERPPGRPAAGFWEFPGGKAEPGEPLIRALTRELREELGIEVESAAPWLCFAHAAGGRPVHLQFFRVRAWRGEPVGREGQRLRWVDPAEPAVAPLLPFNDRMLRALTLPPYYAITAAGILGVDRFLPRLDEALRRGIRLIQVREPGMSREDLRAFAGEVIAKARPFGARVLINGDEELAIEAGADGVHLPSRQLMAARAAPKTALWAASCHDREELAQAVALGADFAVLSPVLPTESHPGVAGLGWAAFGDLVRGHPLPVYALGGMREEMCATAQLHGGHGIALMRGIW
jgi:8-oxo-dGTP diphosphatase